MAEDEHGGGRLDPGTRLGLAGTTTVGMGFGMIRWAFGLTLPEVRSSFGIEDAALGLLASGSFFGFIAGLTMSRVVAYRLGPRAPVLVGCAFGVVGCIIAATSLSPSMLAVGTVIAGSAPGWVYAPYSELVTRTTPAARHPGLLALVTSGASGGLVVMGVAAAIALPGFWRAIWVVVAVAAGCAGVLNLLWTPRSSPVATSAEARPAPRTPRTGLVALYGYSVTFTGVSVTYFTFATDAVRRGGLPPTVGGLLFVVVGVAGLIGLRTGRLANRWGAVRVGSVSVLVLGLALVLLALSGGSVVGVFASAAFSGAGYMVGAACLSIWSTQLRPDRARSTFTTALTVGALASVLAPALVGQLRAVVGLREILLWLAVVAGLLGIAGIRFAAAMGPVLKDPRSRLARGR